MRFSFLLASTLTFGFATATVLPRAGTPQQCQSACSALDSQVAALLAGGNANATAAVCSNTIFQGLKSCFECGYQLSPSSFTPDTVQAVQNALNEFASECNKQGFSVQSVTLNTSGKSAASSRYQGSVKVAGAVGAVAVAGLLAL